MMQNLFFAFVYNWLGIQFTASPARAFVSCSKDNQVQVFDPTTRQVITNLLILGDRPKAMAVSPDASHVYVAIFESGNASTILADPGRTESQVSAVILSHPSGPYGGQMPVPNDGLNLRPPLNPNFDPEFTASDQPISIIVKKNAAGRWMDDNNGDWSEFVSGTNSALSGRPLGWNMPDRDLAVIDTTTYGINYAGGLMNICMDIAVNPASGVVAVIGTDGTNERRFEPNLRGTFLRVNIALVDPVTGSKSIVDLNPHLDYSTSSAPVAVRDRSLGDPRGIVWNSSGTRGYVTGMGSRNLVDLRESALRRGGLREHSRLVSRRDLDIARREGVDQTVFRARPVFPQRGVRQSHIRGGQRH